jgi:hypothetical protein
MPKTSMPAAQVDIIDFDPALHHVYVPAGGHLAIVGVSSAGHLTTLGSIGVPGDAHCVVSSRSRRKKATFAATSSCRPFSKEHDEVLTIGVCRKSVHDRRGGGEFVVADWASLLRQDDDAVGPRATAALKSSWSLLAANPPECAATFDAGESPKSGE